MIFYTDKLTLHPYVVAIATGTYGKARITNTGVTQAIIEASEDAINWKQAYSLAVGTSKDLTIMPKFIRMTSGTLAYVQRTNNDDFSEPSQVLPSESAPVSSEILERITALEQRTDNDTIYNDTNIIQRLIALEQRTDRDTVYDDTSIIQRIEALESMPSTANFDIGVSPAYWQEILKYFRKTVTDPTIVENIELPENFNLGISFKDEYGVGFLQMYTSTSLDFTGTFKAKLIAPSIENFPQQIIHITSTDIANRSFNKMVESYVRDSINQSNYHLFSLEMLGKTFPITGYTRFEGPE